MMNPGNSFTVDEVYYVPAALHYLRPITTAVQPATLMTEDRWVPYYVNPEHPPLAKLMIASGIAIFGNNPLGWRFFSTLIGSLSVPGIYFAARRLSPKTALFAAAFYAFYPMDISMSQIAMLDVYATAFTIFSVAALANDRPKLAAVFLGLAAASKLTGVVVGLPLLYYVLITNRGSIKKILRVLVTEAIIAVAVFLAAYIPMAVYFGVKAVIVDLFYIFLVQQHYGPGPGVLEPFSWLITFSSAFNPKETFNPTIFLNNPVLTVASIMGLVYALTRLRQKQSIVLTGYFLAAFGLIVAASAERPIYYFYLEDAAPVFALLAAYFMQGLIDLNSSRAKICAYLLSFAVLLGSALVVPILLYGYSVPYANALTTLGP
jgi:predicted membrane-bound dolichyl-phosphate-mannose-protein mannosyltransferase